jgi:hypothetical protein
MIYIVLGMHKSGTSLVSEILHHSGVAMVEDDNGPGLDYDTGNKHEREAVFALDNDILDSHGVESIMIPFPRELRVDAAVRARMHAVVNGAPEGSRDWGFKDPRLCLTYPAWRDLLPEHRLIGIYRSPYALATRYETNRSVRRAYRMLASWHEHNLRMLSYVEDTPHPWLLLRYERLMEGDAELGRLARFIGRDVTDRRRTELRRSAPSRSLAMRVAETGYRARTGRTTRDTLRRLEEYGDRSAGAA